MNKSFSLCAFADEGARELEGQIEALKANGIGLLELRGVDGRSVAKMSLEDARRIRDRLDENEIRVWAVGAPTGKYSLEEDFIPHFDEFRRILDLAEEFGATCYRLFSFFVTRENGVVSPVQRDMALERMERMVEAAKGSSVILCHENEKGIYGQTAEACLDIHRSLPSLRAIVDPGNFVQVGQDVMQAWELLEPYVEYLHVKDVTADGRGVPAGHGIGHVAELIACYGANGGRVLSVEPHLTVKSGDDADAAEPFVYPTKRAAFDAAVQALQQML